MGAADREIKVEILTIMFIQVLDDCNDISTVASLKEVGTFLPHAPHLGIPA